MKKKKYNFLLKAVIYVAILIVLFFATILGTKYFVYDRDDAVKKTDLTMIDINGIKLGMNISELDLSSYTTSDKQVEDCNFNYEGISFKTNSKGKIEYIVADYSMVNFKFSNNEIEKPKKVDPILEELGKNYTTDMYNADENNYRRISKYSDPTNDIYLGLVYSRYNNEMLTIILSEHKIK